MNRFSRFAWFVLAYNVGVILWGAFVRATGSGAGCGEHWPLCNGEVMPRSPQAATLIEFAHRLTSGLDGLFVIGLVIGAFRLFPKGHPVRSWATWSLVLTITEGLIGAWLVLAGHVAQNASLWRGVSLTVHLINTLLLLAALTCTASLSTGRQAVTRRREFAVLPLWLAGAGLLFVGVTGAIAALGDTLFASESLSQGMAQDFSPSAHLFVRLRILHPVVAALVGAGVLLLGVRTLAKNSSGSWLHRIGGALSIFTTLQLAIGTLNLLLLAPVWLQILHLLVADLVWISFVLLVSEQSYEKAFLLNGNEMSMPSRA